MTSINIFISIDQLILPITSAGARKIGVKVRNMVGIKLRPMIFAALLLPMFPNQVFHSRLLAR
jgi:hypothetical protein